MTQQQYWTERYAENRTGWDIGYPSTPLQTYFDQLADKDKRILIPGAGNAYEAEYLHRQGFHQVYVLDISPSPLSAFAERVPDFPEAHLLQGDFFEHEGQYDLIVEQTFFCSFLPTAENRSAYARRMNGLLKPGGKLVGLWFDFPLNPEGNRPFGGTRAEYLSYLEPYFEVETFGRSYNSIKPRMGKELFGIFVK
ncbi:MAG: methyltransferase domain-containing protein [Bacteroidota bacterium]